MKPVTVFFIIGLLLSLPGCYVMPVEQQSPPVPTLTWKPITIRAIGQGAPPARSLNAAQARIMTQRAAKLDAYRNLLENAYGVNISSRSNVKDFILRNDSIKARVDAYVRGAQVVHTIYHDDGGIEVEMEITLRQDFRQLF